MAAPPLLCLGAGFVAGLYIGSLGPAVITFASSLACAACAPLPLRARLAVLALAVGAVWPTPSETSPPQMPVVGEVEGPVLRELGQVRFSLRHANGVVAVVASADGAGSRAVVSPCDQVRIRGRHSASRRGEWTVAVSASQLDVRSRDCLSFWSLADQLHLELRQAAGTGGGRDLVRAMALGDRSRVGAADKYRFRIGGVAHVLAVSGLHLAVVTSLAFFAARRLASVVTPALAPTRCAAVVALMVAIAFTAVSGARISTIRALWMAAAILIVRIGGRHLGGASALAVAVIGATAAAPHRIFEPGFQLSVVATAILLSCAGTSSRFSGAVAYGLRAIQATAAATLATAPITAVHFSEVSPAGVVSNLAIVPITELCVVPLGLLGAVLAWVAPGLGEPVLNVAAFFAELAALIAGVLGESIGTWPGPTSPLGVLTALSSALVIARLGKRDARYPLLFLAFFVVLRAWPSPEPAHLRLTFVDVGQGDGIILQWPNRAVWLVDVGPRMRTHRIGPMARSLRRRGIEAIDKIVITHPHPDHDGALDEITSLFEVREVWRAAGSPRPESMTEAPLLGRHRVGGAAVWLLGPRYIGDEAMEDPVLSTNDNSLVLLLSYGGRTVLLTGDIEDEAEERLLAVPGVGDVDVVKVPHHGSATSSSQRLVDRTRPLAVVISAGRNNPFGHPSRKVVDRWHRGGARVLRTDEMGTIELSIAREGAMELRYQRPR